MASKVSQLHQSGLGSSYALNLLLLCSNACMRRFKTLMTCENAWWLDFDWDTIDTATDQWHDRPRSFVCADGGHSAKGGVLNITAAVWTAGFHWWRSGNKKRTQNVSEYMLVLAVCLILLLSKCIPYTVPNLVSDIAVLCWKGTLDSN